MMPATPAPEENGSRELAVRSVSRSALEVVALMRAAQTSPTLPLFLDLKAAVTYSGHPETYLRELIAEKKLKAVKGAATTSAGLRLKSWRDDAI
jgi:hypothetical protein